ncbi:MAG: hypothetical protein M3Z35_09605, partial [Nitrospirota bacterium]|nr:hypothetical protein [Nitrospirota bacterium]
MVHVALMMVRLLLSRTRLNCSRKWILAGFRRMLDLTVVDQVKALQGVSTEFMHRPDSWGSGAYQYQQFIDAVKEVASNGGTVQLDGNWCYTDPSDYTGGTYASSAARYRMWRLASYYILKEPVGSSGVVYFDLALCSNATMQPLSDPSEWLPAYQVNVGQPVGDSYVHQRGTAGIASSDGRHCPYQIFGRTYTNALMLVRPKDFWDCTDYGDGGAAVVTLSHPGYLLKEDGTLSAQTTTVTLRNAEAVIMYGISTPPSSTPSTPSTVTETSSMQTLISTTPPTPTTPATSPTPSSSPSSTSNRPTTERSSESVASGFFHKLKNLMQRVKYNGAYTGDYMKCFLRVLSILLAVLLPSVGWTATVDEPKLSAPLLPPRSSPAHTLTHVELKQSGGEATILISGDGRLSYRIRPLSTDRVIVDLLNVSTKLTHAFEFND